MRRASVLSAGFCRYAQFDVSLLLKRVHDAKEVVRAGVATRSQHPMQALAWLLEREGQLFKPYSGIDEIPEDGFAYGSVACKVGVERLCKQRFPKARVTFHASRDDMSKLPCESHKSLCRDASNDYVTTAVRRRTSILPGGRGGQWLIKRQLILRKEVQRQLVGFVVGVLEQGVFEDCVVGGRGHEQGHAGPEFKIVGITEDLFSAAPVYVENKLRTFSEPGTQPALFTRVRDETAKTPRETGARSCEGRRHT